MIDRTLSKASRWGRRNINALFCIILLLFAISNFYSGSILWGSIWLILAVLLYYPLIRSALLSVWRKVTGKPKPLRPIPPPPFGPQW